MRYGSTQKGPPGNEDEGHKFHLNLAKLRTSEEHRGARERKQRAECDAPCVGKGPGIWSKSGA